MRFPAIGVALLCSLAASGAATRQVSPYWASAVESAETTPDTQCATSNRVALDEMLLGVKGKRQFWTRTPELVVLTSVMAYRGPSGVDSVGLPEQLTRADADALEADLTDALRLLSDGTYAQFAAIHREPVAAGARTALSRPGQIVVGRFAGLRTQSHTIGFGGRAARADGSISGGAVILDRDFDQTSNQRALLRMHELGHALGYNHVLSQTSIMNPSIGPSPTPFDRMAVQAATDRNRTRSAN